MFVCIKACSRPPRMCAGCAQSSFEVEYSQMDFTFARADDQFVFTSPGRVYRKRSALERMRFPISLQFSLSLTLCNNIKTLRYLSRKNID